MSQYELRTLRNAIARAYRTVRKDYPRGLPFSWLQEYARARVRSRSLWVLSRARWALFEAWIREETAGAFLRRFRS